MQGRNSRGDDAGGLWEGREQAQEAPSEANAKQASGKAEHGGFCLDEQHDAPALPAQGAQDADLACTLED
jgi:hypothetical protein